MSRTVLWGPVMGSLGPAVAAVGVFDGVHIGHQALIRDAVALARHGGVSAVVVTFDRDPDQVVTPAAAAPQLLDLGDKLEFLSAAGADVVLVVPFTPELARTGPLVFLDEVLLGAMSPVSVVVGSDFRFGHRAEGDVNVLGRYGAEHGFTVVAHDLVGDAGLPVTSTRVRGLVASGEVAEAGRLLGRPHRVRGVVGHGRSLGAELDAPTANMNVAPFAALPADGVYAARVALDEGVHAAAVSVGLPPSFPEATDIFEAHLLDFDGDLYGRTLTVEFLARIRALERFDTPAALAGRIHEDIAAVRRVAYG